MSYKHEITPRLDPETQTPSIESIYGNEASRIQHIPISSIFGLHDHMRGLLQSERNWHERGVLAAQYADEYHLEFESEVQEPTMVLSRTYLSAISSMGHLRHFMFTGSWTGRRSEETNDCKLTYLAARKKFQEDVDDLFDMFADVPEDDINEALRDIAGMSRILITGHQWVNSETDTHNHIFLGSILSERVVKVSLQNFVNPQARYGDEHEDASPIKADIVLPGPNGDTHVQVKMKWARPPKDIKVSPLAKPTRVVVPMPQLRGSLSLQEQLMIAENVIEANESLAA